MSEASMGRMTLITGDERRRRWSDADRARILSEIEAPGAVVAEVARREDICTSLVYNWRREARKPTSACATGFTPVVIEASPAQSPPQSAAPEVIVVEVNDARVRIGAGASSALVAATLKALRP